MVNGGSCGDGETIHHSPITIHAAARSVSDARVLANDRVVGFIRLHDLAAASRSAEFRIGIGGNVRFTAGEGEARDDEQEQGEEIFHPASITEPAWKRESQTAAVFGDESCAPVLREILGALKNVPALSEFCIDCCAV